MELGNIIAWNLKKLRCERNLTQGQLAKAAGVSKAMVSEIEKGGSNPTINTLWKLAKGLNVPYTQLMAEIDADTTIIRKEDAPMLDGEQGHYRIYSYFKNTPTRNFELFYCELDGNSSNESIGHLDTSQEYVYVIDGELELQVGADLFHPSRRRYPVRPFGLPYVRQSAADIAPLSRRKLLSRPVIAARY
mgnify:CR=1 FL=1